LSTAPAETTEPTNAGTEAPPETPPTTPEPPKQEERQETFDRDYVERLRSEAAENRTKARDAETAAQQEAQAKIDAILKAAGIKTGDDEDPVKAAEAQAQENATRAETAEQERDQAKRELAIYKTATTEGADTDLLLDSTSFLNATRDIAPDDAEGIQKAIKKALDDNPRFRSAQAAGQSGGDFTGGTGERQIDQAAFDAMNPAQKNDLFNTNPTLYRQLSGR
jgi:outer membrane biosynthesis protein TonB